MTDHTGPIAFKNIGGLRVIDCEACGYAHLDPLPEQADIDRLYQDEYYQSHHPGWFEKERREQWYWRKVYRRRMKQAWSVLNGVHASNYGKFWLLDIGSGCGWFPHAMNIYKWWEPVAYEPSKEARRWSMQKLHDVCFISSLEFAESIRWHFIHCSLVLEHVLDPPMVLRDINNRLLPGGVACVVVPNERNPLQRQLARRYNYSPVHPHHVNYFDADSLTRLAERAGFEIVRVTSTFPIEWFALHGLNYVKHPKLGIFAHWIRMAIEATALTIAPARWERLKDRWAAKGIGREVELWIQKRDNSSRVQVGGWGFPADVAKRILEDEHE